MESNYWNSYWRRRLSRRGFVVGGATAAIGSAALLAAGCGDDDDNGGGDAGPAQPTAKAATPTPQGEQPVRGGTLRMSKYEADTGIDPPVRVVSNQEIIPGLYSFTHSYRLSTNEVLLDLATSYQQSDPLALTFKIREGVKFHNVAPMNGRVLTSEDLKFSYERFPIARKELGGQVNEIIWGWIDKVETPDKSTVVIKQKYPFASNLAAMGGTVWAITAKEAIGSKNLIEGDAGSGPFLLKKRDASGTRLERNPDYFKHTNPAPTYVEDGPYIDAWDTRILPDPAAVKSAFLAGDLDVLNTIQVQIDKLTFDEYKNNKDFVAEKVPALGHIGMAYDMLKFGDARLREAVSLAIDRNAIIATIYAGDGKYDGPVNNGLVAFALSQDELKKYQQFDPKKAKELWQAAGGNEKFGGTLRMVTTPAIPPFANMTDIVSKQLESNLGVKVKIEAVDVATYVSRALSPDPKPWELFVASETSAPTIPDYNSLTHYIPKGYGGGTWNFKEDSPVPDVAKLAKEATRLNDLASSAIEPKDRKAKMDDLQKFFMTNFCPWLSLPVAAYSYSIVRKTLRNWPHQDNASGFPLRAHNVWIAKA